METMIKRSLSMRFRRTTVGCGIQGEDCLALAVSGREGAWRIAWSLMGKLDDADFARRLSAKVWRRPLWSPPLERRESSFLSVCGIDLSFGGGKKKTALSAKEIQAALRTQVMGRHAHSTGETMICGLEMRGPDGERHLVGAANSQRLIRYSYEEWCGTMGIIHPHIGSSAAALANLYLALYPESKRRQNPVRLVVLEGRETTLAALLDDWRLLDAIQFRMMEGQRLDSLLLAQWISFLRERNHLQKAPLPCVVAFDGTGNSPEGFEAWVPFENAWGVQADPATLDAMRADPDLASLAFGMALQGA